MATLLQLVRQATAEMGLPVPTAVASSSSPDAVQLMALANAVGYELQREHPWQGLAVEYRFSTAYTEADCTLVEGSAVIQLADTSGIDTSYMIVGTGVNTDVYVESVDSATQITMSQAATASGVQSLTFCKTKYAYPSDYDRPADRTQWDKTKHWEMLGPETPQQWQYLKNGFIATGPRIRFRPMGGKFQIWPPVSSNELLGFEYVSKNWARDANDVAKSSFTADTDTCIFPDRLMVLGLKLKYFEAKQFDTTALYRDWLTQKDIAKATDMGSPILSFAPRAADVLIGWDNIPDSGYGGVSQ
jgi:hypothetical protein